LQDLTLYSPDIVGFSRQMGADEARMLRLLTTHNQVIEQAVAEHHGTVIKIMGDAFLVDFPSVVHAVQCAQGIHAQFRAHNAETEPAEQIHVHIGIHSGDIVQRDGDVFGAVNRVYAAKNRIPFSQNLFFFLATGKALFSQVRKKSRPVFLGL
jgi:class 3 adenylate cyclase